MGQVTDRFIYLDEGDIARITLKGVEIWHGARKVNRQITRVQNYSKDVDKGKFKHFMLKEIYEQPQVIKDTLDGRISDKKVLEQAFGVNAPGDP